MYRFLVFVPAMALIIGPRLWVERVKKKHGRSAITDGRTGAEVARELLDLNDLTTVKVEHTDIGDHYDPKTKAVRLSRSTHDHRTLAACATAAHEVGHALQDATRYPPFRWRSHLVTMARGTGAVGGVLLISAPLAALVARTPIPSPLLGATVCSVLGTSLAAQLATLPTEMDASFRRAIPMLQARYLDDVEAGAAREILLACSLTYVASSLALVMQLWPWLPLSRVMLCQASGALAETVSVCSPRQASEPRKVRGDDTVRIIRVRRPSTVQRLVRRFGKPILRVWYQAQSGSGATPRIPSTRSNAKQRQRAL